MNEKNISASTDFQEQRLKSEKLSVQLQTVNCGANRWNFPLCFNLNIKQSYNVEYSKESLKMHPYLTLIH